MISGEWSRAHAASVLAEREPSSLLGGSTALTSPFPSPLPRHPSLSFRKMLADTQQNYGALEGQETTVEKQSIPQRLGAKYVLGFAAVALLTAGVVVISANAGVSQGNVASVVDANRNRATIARVRGARSSRNARAVETARSFPRADGQSNSAGRCRGAVLLSWRTRL